MFCQQTDWISRIEKRLDRALGFRFETDLKRLESNLSTTTSKITKVDLMWIVSINITLSSTGQVEHGRHHFLRQRM
jgi:hypothetical protein